MSASVDVLIPCYNYGRFLRDCVDSALTQEGVRVRVLILDDASSDDSETIGLGLATSDARIEYRRHRINRGHIATYNEGIEWAASDYFLLLSADDLLVPGALLRAVQLMEADAKLGLVYGHGLVFDGDDRPSVPTTPQPEGWKRLSGAEFLERICQMGGNPVPTPTAVVRTAVQKEIGGYRPQLPHTGDMEMWMRVAVCADVACLNANQAFYRWHKTNMTHGYRAQLLGDMSERARAFDMLFAQCGSRIPKSAELHQLSKSTLAGQAYTAAAEAFEAGDLSVFTAGLEFARACVPDVVESGPWRRLRWKAMLGVRICSWIRPITNRLGHIWSDDHRHRTSADLWAWTAIRN